MKEDSKYSYNSNETSQEDTSTQNDKYDISGTWLQDENNVNLDLLNLDVKEGKEVKRGMMFFIKLTKAVTVLLFIIAISLAILGYKNIIYTFNGDNIYGVFLTIGLINILNTRFFYFKNKELSNKLLFFNILILIMIFGQAISDFD